jgi:hypothetical protein
MTEQSVVAMQIIGNRERARQILATTGEHLHHGPITGDASGYVSLVFGMAYEEAWDAIRAALDISADDWREHIELYR